MRVAFSGYVRNETIKEYRCHLLKREGFLFFGIDCSTCLRVATSLERRVLEGKEECSYKR